MTLQQVRKVDKPWGYELHWALTDIYIGKVLFIESGESLSVQYHEVKDETIYIEDGIMALYVGDTADSLEKVVMTKGMSYHIPPGLIHQMESVEDCMVYEVSTPQLDDVVRIKDRYGRAKS